MNTTDYGKYVPEIVNALNALSCQGLPNSRPIWTKRIKDALAAIGTRSRLHVCPGNAPGDEHEWLYDLVWYRNNENSRLEQVPLVLESEWNMDPYDIRVDFEKLLVATSPLKVMVCQNHADKVKETLTSLECGINEYLFGVRSIYILACYSPDGSRVEIRTLKKEPDKAAEPMHLNT